MDLNKIKKIKLPDTSGVYFFQKGKKILYIGKATSLKDRIKSYFSSDLIKTRGLLLVDMITQADNIKYKTTKSVLEALLLETELIKKYKPYYNTKEKDDKSYSFVQITNEDFPIIKIVRGKNLTEKEKISKDVFGPFVSKDQLRNALKIIRKIVPYRDEKCLSNKNKPCFNYTIGLCPGTCINKISKKDYQKQINKFRLFLSGDLYKLSNSLKKEMNILSKAKRFEDAGNIRDKIYALNHINDIALINKDNNKNDIRIESYDIAHMSGQNMVGVMCVMINGEFKKDEYKKFIIKTVDGPDDIKALYEVLDRRFKHNEWNKPSLIVIDGGKVQLNIAQKFFKDSVSVVKDNKHKAKDVLNKEILRDKNINEDEIIKINAETHRFAISFFRKKMRGGIAL